MIYYIKEMEEDFLNDFIFWSNNRGEFIKDGKELTYDELPEELRSVHTELWEENKEGLSCCLAQYKGEYGIALIADYSRSSQTNNLDMAKRVAKTLDEKLSKTVSIIIAYDLGPADESGGCLTNVILFWPSITSQAAFNTDAKTFGEMAYKAEKQTLYSEYQVPFTCELYGRITVKAKNKEEAKAVAAVKIDSMTEDDVWKNTTLLRNTLKVDDRSKILM
ncbi:hypothetical protein [Oribacterium sp. WCC10]|uniref:hypothetical protein n=1 Tax=Oribacterium sp. WCC10 TaxID=1855343 RepID=UPI0008EA536C|nr:hypothetical protein [Oribacterium sp. WCC10]SFG21687.1 hypothetical protein SAMN05216356_103194 [Oribacterium sp. WCC10]